MAKTRKASRKSSAKKTASKRPAAKKGTKKKATRRAAASSRVARTRSGELNLKPLKQQLKAHIDALSKTSQDNDQVRAALASLQRVQSELNDACIPTMTIPI